MEKIYRVTPKDGGWIVQRKSDRKTMHKPFIKQKEAEAYELELLAQFPQANGDGKAATKTVLILFNIQNRTRILQNSTISDHIKSVSSLLGSTLCKSFGL